MDANSSAKWCCVDFGGQIVDGQSPKHVEPTEIDVARRFLPPDACRLTCAAQVDAVSIFIWQLMLVPYAREGAVQSLTSSFLLSIARLEA